MDLRLILVLCALAATRVASQSDILNGQCAKQCKSSELNEYPNGLTHVYKYSTRTLVNSWNTEIDVKGEVLLTRLTTCDYSLELRNVAIDGVPEARSWEEQLRARSLRFSWIDGEVTDVCHHPEEEEWVINVKKAILSSLQVVGTSGYVAKVERDILGDCQTIYQQGDVTNDRIVMFKTKDIASCEYHTDDKLASALETVLAQGKPEYQCKQTWSSKYVLKSVKCGHVALAQTKTVSNLTMEHVKTESKSLATPLESFRRSQLHASRVEMPKKSVSEVTATLTELCQSVETQIKSQSASTFRDFAQSLETLKYEDLKKVWNSLINGQIHETCSNDRVKVMFVDAILQSRTGPGLKLLVKDLFKGKYISEMKLKSAIYSLIYKPRPCAETMEAISELLRSEQSFVQTLFGMTAAIQRYYELTHDRVAATLAVDLILNRLHKANEDQKVVIVRALSNIRFEAEKLIKNFEKYFDSAEPELKVAIIEALNLVDSCHESVYGKIQKMVLSTAQPNEIRTRALKVYLRCADEEAVNELKRYIESRPEDEHFVSYADSYLRNALTTMNPDKQIVKEIANLGRESWKAPRMTMARNVEFSKMGLEGKFGLNYEIDSIVEKGQEVPTWFVVNSSIPIRRVNSLNFEIGVRQEGLDKFATKLMNQLSQIKAQNWEKIIMEAKDRKDYQPIVKELTKLIEEIQQLAEKTAKVSAYIKINGVTVFYLNGAESSFDRRESLQRLVIENTEARKALEASLGWMFVDYKVNTPLASGLTLRYKHEGSIIPGLKATLKSQSTSSEHVFGFFPNFAVEFVYGRELVLQKPVASKLVKFNLNSDVALEGIHTLIRSGAGKAHKFVLNTKEEMDLLRLEVAKVTRDSNGVEIKEQSYPDLKEKWCSTEYTEKIFGFVFCFDGQEEVSALRMKKDARIIRRLYAKKTDKSLKTYELIVKMEEGVRGFILDTPNTKINRKVEVMIGKSGNFNVKKNLAGKVWLLVNLPVKSFEVNVSAAFPTGQEWTVALDTQVDRQVHSARLTLAPKSNRQQVLNFMINSPILREKLDYDLTFTSPYDAANEIMAQIHSNRMGNKRNRLALIKVIRSQQEQNNLAKIELELNNERSEKILSLLLDGSMKGTFPVVNAIQYNGKVEYRRRQGKMETVQLNGNHKVDTTGEAKAYTNNWEVKTTQWPQINGKATHKMFLKMNEHLENEMELRWGRDYDQESTLNRIVLRQVSSIKTGAKNVVEMKTTIIAENRAAHFNHKLESKINYIPRSMELFKYELIHSDLNKPENNHKLVIDHKITAQSEGSLNLALSSQRGSRSIKTTYTLNKKSPKMATIYKVEPVGQSVRGYHVAANLNRESAKKTVSFEISTHPENKQIFRTEADLVQERSKALANLKIVVRDQILANAEYERNADQIKGKMTLPRSGSIEANLDRRMKSIRFVTKDSKDWTHELVAGIGEIKQLKSTTLSGVAVLPNFDFHFNPHKQYMRLSLRSPKIDFHTQLTDYLNEPVLTVEFKCVEHRDRHMSTLKWMKDSKTILSEHEQKGIMLYTAELTSERKNGERVAKLIFKAGDFETRAQNVLNGERRTNKFDFIASNNKNMETKISAKLALPAQRTRFGRKAQLEMPKIDIKINYKKNGEETSMLIANEQMTKIHLQHRTRNSVPFVVDSKFESEKWTIVGNAGELKYNLIIVPSADVKSIDLNLDGYNKQGKFNLALTKEASSWTVTTESKLILNGEKKLDGKMEAKISKNLVSGPHKFTVSNLETEMGMIYKLEDNKLQVFLTAANQGQKLIDAKFNGEKFVRGKVTNVAGKFDVSSDKINALRQAVYEVEYNRDGRKVDVRVEKKGNNPMNMKVSADIARESAKINAEINGRTASGKQRKLAIDYNRLNKIDFSVKLFDMSKVDSELGASIPLVKISEFIGNEASLFIKSKSFDSEATLSLKAPLKDSITGLATIKIRGQQWLQYNLAINDGSKVQFFGADKINNQLTNPIAILNEIIFKGRQIFTHNLMISDKIISLKVESPTLFKVNQAFIMKERVPEVLGKYCYKTSCSKMTSKWVLGQKGLIEMNLEGPNGDEQKYDIYFKWNGEEGKEYGSVLLVKNQRKYGYEWSRLVKNDLNTVFDTKITLPKRVMTITTTKDVKSSSNDKYQGQWIVVIRPKENADELKITFDRNVKRAVNNLKYDNHVTFEHKTLSRPVKVITSLNLLKSDAKRYNLLGVKSADLKLGLNFEGESTHDLNGAFFWEVNEDKLNYNWRIWEKESKIDFGCKGDYLSTGSIKSRLFESLKDYSCHWVDRNGQRKELKREQKISMGSNILGDLPRLTFHDNIKHPLGSYFYNGTFHLFEAIKDATIDFHTQDGQRYQLQAKFDTTKQEKCFEMSFVEKDNEEGKYGLRTCFNPKARSGKSVFLFEMITFGKKINMADGERKATFSINRMKDFANDYLISLIWDTTTMAQATYQAIDAVEQMSNKRNAMINERNAELKAKMDYIRESLGQKITKAKKHINTEVDELTEEMRPELNMIIFNLNKAIGSKRSKRCIFCRRTERKTDLSSPMTYEWKEYDIDNGRLELILRNVEAQKVPQFVYQLLLKHSLI